MKGVIDWKEVAEKNGLTLELFSEEIYLTACAVAAMDLDKTGDIALRFTCSDEVGPIELFVRRPKSE